MTTPQPDPNGVQVPMAEVERLLGRLTFNTLILQLQIAERDREIAALKEQMTGRKTSTKA